MPQWDKNGIVTLQNAVSGTANGTNIRASGWTVGVFQVTGTFVGTITPQQTIDGVNWNPLTVSSASAQNTGSIITGTGLYKADVAGLGTVRMPVTAYTSGTLSVIGDVSQTPFGPLLTSSSGASSGGGTTAISGTVPVQEAYLQAGEDLVNVPNATNIRVNPSFVTNILSAGTAGTAAIGTLVAAPGAGTAIYICSFTVDGDSTTLGTTEVILSFGTQTTGTAVLFRATINNLNETVLMPYTYPVNCGVTNLPLTYLINSGAGSIAWTVQYYTH